MIPPQVCDKIFKEQFIAFREEEAREVGGIQHGRTMQAREVGDLTWENNDHLIFRPRDAALCMFGVVYIPTLMLSPSPCWIPQEVRAKALHQPGFGPQGGRGGGMGRGRGVMMMGRGGGRGGGMMMMGGGRGGRGGVGGVGPAAMMIDAGGAMLGGAMGGMMPMGMLPMGGGMMPMMMMPGGMMMAAPMMAPGGGGGGGRGGMPMIMRQGGGGMMMGGRGGGGGMGGFVGGGRGGSGRGGGGGGRFGGGMPAGREYYDLDDPQHNRTVLDYGDL